MSLKRYALIAIVGFLIYSLPSSAQQVESRTDRPGDSDIWGPGSGGCKGAGCPKRSAVPMALSLNGESVAVPHLAASSSEFDNILDIPFKEIPNDYSDCSTTCPDQSSDVACRSWYISQFPEVVKISSATEFGIHHCSGTIISYEWVITAAHCIVGNKSAESLPEYNATEFVLNTNSERKITINVANAFTLKPDQRIVSADFAVINGSYTGWYGQSSDFRSDVALVHTERRFPKHAVIPAQIAGADSFVTDTTIAAFGISDSGAPLGAFALVHPAPATAEDESIVMVAQGDLSKDAGFCAGDSGGPVFAGRYRGCPAEVSPRLIQGVMSHHRDPGVGRGKTVQEQWLNVCRTSSKMVSQLITKPSIINWVNNVIKRHH